MGSGGVAIAALPTLICLKVPFSDGLGVGNIAVSHGDLLFTRIIRVHHGDILFTRIIAVHHGVFPVTRLIL